MLQRQAISGMTVKCHSTNTKHIQQAKITLTHDLTTVNLTDAPIRLILAFLLVMLLVVMVLLLFAKMMFVLTTTPIVVIIIIVNIIINTIKHDMIRSNITGSSADGSLVHR